MVSGAMPVGTLLQVGHDVMVFIGPVKILNYEPPSFEDGNPPFAIVLQ